MVRWHQQLNGDQSEQALGDSEGQGSLVFMGSQRAGHDFATEQQDRINTESRREFNSISSCIFVLISGLLQQ